MDVPYTADSKHIERFRASHPTPTISYQAIVLSPVESIHKTTLASSFDPGSNPTRRALGLRCSMGAVQLQGLQESLFAACLDS
jgi:hypothetical protein